MTATIAPDSEWIDARKAAKILGVPGARNVHRLVKSGLIKTRELPGVRAKYSRADVESLAAEGNRAPRRPMDYLFEILPEPRADVGLFWGLGQYKAARDGRNDRPENEESTLSFGEGFNFQSLLGDMALRLVNRAMDQNWDAFVAALEGPGWDEVDEGYDGYATRLWETLARLQAEEQTGQGATDDDTGIQPGPRAGTASEETVGVN